MPSGAVLPPTGTGCSCFLQEDLGVYAPKQDPSWGWS